jgi:hypothetical protein
MRCCFYPVLRRGGKLHWGLYRVARVKGGNIPPGANIVYCDVTERNRVAMSRHRHNVASRHYDGSRRCCYSGIN